MLNNKMQCDDQNPALPELTLYKGTISTPFLFFIVPSFLEAYLKYFSAMSMLTGPVSPQSVTVDSVGDDHVNISWTVSAFMLMTPHSYNVTICAQKYETFLYSHTDGSSAMNISISNLTSVTQYFIEISAFVVRPNNLTGRNVILQNDPATLEFITGEEGTFVIDVWGVLY